MYTYNSKTLSSKVRVTLQWCYLFYIKWKYCKGQISLISNVTFSDIFFGHSVVLLTLILTAWEFKKKIGICWLKQNMI
jgi:hypothetical protein